MSAETDEQPDELEALARFVETAHILCKRWRAGDVTAADAMELLDRARCAYAVAALSSFEPFVGS